MQKNLAVLLSLPFFLSCSSSSRHISSAESPEAVFDHPAFSEVSPKARAAAKEIFGYRKINEKHYRETDPGDLSPVNVRRDTHAKTHGCVKASFEVNPNLPEHLRVGLFAEPAKYNAWVRFANGLGTIKHDLLGDARAMSVKVMGVRGKKVLDSFPGEELFTQDFIFNNSPTFFVDGIDDAKEFFAAEASGEIKSYFKSALLNPLQRSRKKTIFVATLLSTKVEPNLLRATYWSGTPYRFGQKKAQYVVRACNTQAEYRGLPGLNADEQELVNNMNGFFQSYSPLVGKNPDFQDFPSGVRWLGFLKNAAGALGWNESYAGKLDPKNRDYLRDNLTADLESGREGCFEFGVQMYKDEKSTPINRATVMWKSKPEWIGRVRIPAQDDAASPDRIAFCENLSFNTWHALPEHRPVGELNEIRGLIYKAMSAYRHDENGVGGGEPLSDFRSRLASQNEAAEFYK